LQDRDTAVRQTAMTSISGVSANLEKEFRRFTAFITMGMRTDSGP